MSRSGTVLKEEAAKEAAKARTERLALSVYSEIGQLREVLVHSPGREVDAMPPALMHELLFDDIIYGPKARVEHAEFRAVLEKLGAVVTDFQQLLAESLEIASTAEIGALLMTVQSFEGLEDETVEWLEGLSAAELAAALVHGVKIDVERPDPNNLFCLNPLPNLLFSRDAQVVLGNRLIISGMNHRSRQREPILGRFVFNQHSRLRREEMLIDFSSEQRPWATAASAPSFEGGDLLVFQEGVVVVGVGERTMEASVNLLVESLRGHERFHTLIMVPMPRTRAVMHLDTIFTRISERECLVYAPMMLPGNHETLSVVSIDLRAPEDWGSRRRSLLDALKRVGVDLEPVCCGGRYDYITQAREQWTDGANSFAVRPGVILIYSRNVATAAELAQRDYKIVSTRDMDFENRRCLYDFEPGRKYAILVCGEELSRARGGPRCMTMPLVRE